MKDKVRVFTTWRGCRGILIVGGLLTGLCTTMAVADDDLGVTMRMVTDDDITGTVTREIVLPEPASAREPGPAGAPGQGTQPQSGNPFMGGGRPDRERGRPDVVPSDIRNNASDIARDRRPGGQRPGGGPGLDRPDRPEGVDQPGRPDRPDKPDVAPDRPERPGNGNRP